MTEPHWTAYVTACAVPLIGIFGVWIAYTQSKIARNKLKLDLFDRRMAVYEAADNTLREIYRHGKLSSEKQLEYVLNTKTARWLFPPHAAEYFDKTLWENINTLEMYNVELGEDWLSSDSDERRELIKSRVELNKWFFKQATELPSY